MDAFGRHNSGWKAGPAEKHAEPIISTPVLGQAIPGRTLDAVVCPLCGKPAWPLNGATSFAHKRVEIGPFNASYDSVCAASAEVRRG